MIVMSNKIKFSRHTSPLPPASPDSALLGFFLLLRQIDKRNKKIAEKNERKHDQQTEQAKKAH